MAEIILTFEWDGKTIHKETKGFIGSDCVKKTEFIEKALGKTENRTLKSEYYDDESEEHEENKDQIRY